MKRHENTQDMISLRVWDLPTRLFHWSLVLVFVTSWTAVTTNYMTVHIVSGSIALTLVLFRLIWGVLGSTTARFSDFVKPPQATLAYLRDVRAGHLHPIAGHNPAGGMMIVVMLVMLLVQASTGLFANDDVDTEGPLAHLVSDEISDLLTILHKASFKLLLAMVVVHISAALFYLVVKHDNLIRPMFTGSKLWPVDVPQPALRFTNPLLAVALVALVGGGVWYLVT